MKTIIFLLLTMVPSFVQAQVTGPCASLSEAAIAAELEALNLAAEYQVVKAHGDDLRLMVYIAGLVVEATDPSGFMYQQVLAIYNAWNYDASTYFIDVEIPALIRWNNAVIDLTAKNQALTDCIRDNP